MTSRLDGKVVMVTGAASGIGAATARLAKERGAQVVATDIDGAGAGRLADELKGLGLTLDVGDTAQWDAAMADTVKRYGRLDGLVSCAGVASFGPLVDLGLEEFRRVARVQVEGTFLALQQAAAQMRAQANGGAARGSIVVVSSVMASQAAPGTATYCAVKAAISNMARAVGVELGRKGDFIRVNTVAPGPVRTPMLAVAIGAEALADPAKWQDVPLGVPAEPEDVAETIVFHLSDDASFLTASQLIVDGGWSLT